MIIFTCGDNKTLSNIKKSLNIMTRIVAILRHLTKYLFEEPFKNDVTTKTQNSRPPSAYVTVSHFFHYRPSPHVTTQIVTNFFLDQGP